jgi:hypothetical protein
MMLLAIGLGALGFFAWRRAHRRCFGHAHGYGPGGCGRGGWGRHRGHRGWRSHHDGRRWMIDRALEHLDASPAQERAIIAELQQLEERVHAAGRRVRDQRGPLADAVRGAELDVGALAGVDHELEQAGAEARTAAIEAVRRIHALLDDHQRERLAALLGRGARERGPRDGGPFRT